MLITNSLDISRLSIGNTFEREAAGAVLDFTEDDNDGNKPKRRWSVPGWSD